MYRFTSRISNSHLILVKQKLNDGSCAALVFMRAPRRLYANTFKDEKDGQPRPKSRKFLYGLAGFTILAGSAIVYAKNTPQVRIWIENHASPLDRVIDIAYQEHQTYYEFASEQLGNISSAISSFLFGKPGGSPLDLPSRSTQDLEKDAKKAYAPKEYRLPPPTLEPLYKEEKPLEPAEVKIEATLVQTEKCDPPEPSTVHVTKDIVEIEKEMLANTKAAVENFLFAKKACQEYGKALVRAMETPPDEACGFVFTWLKKYGEDRETAEKTAKEAAAKALDALESLSKKLDSGEVQAPPENVAQARRHINTFTQDIQRAERDFQEECERTIFCKRFFDKAVAARERFRDELQILFPGTDLTKCPLDAKGEIDLLLNYAMKQYAILEAELAEMQTIRAKQLSDALDCNDKDGILEAKITESVKKDRLQREMEFQKTLLKVSAEHQKKMREELRKQGEVLTEIMNAAIAKKQAEIQSKVTRQASEEIEKERVEFKKQLAAMAGKMKAIETTLKQRQVAENEARKAHTVWAAAEALLAATRRPEPHARVDTEIKALEKVGGEDRLVASVVKGIPKETRDQGIITEKALKEQFDKLEQTAYKVALVGSEGASLPVYFLSWLQSKLLFQEYAEIPASELENQPTDFSKLDNNDILYRARYYMDRNELPNALRYVNLLKGAARAAAEGWARQAIRHLEVKQAAETVMAHAALSGTLYL